MMLDTAAAPLKSTAQGGVGMGARASLSGRSVLATLVPNSAIQFLDFEIGEEAAGLTRRRFLEERGEGGEPSLHVAAVGDGVFYHPLTNAPCDPAHTYAISGSQSLAPFLDAWLPLPFMRVSSVADGEATTLDEGPSNWVRVHISRREGATGGYRVVLAVDTAIDADTLGAIDASPSLQDLRAGAAFRFSDDVNDIAWFVSEAWVDDWIKGLYDLSRARAAEEESLPTQDVPNLAHLAHYLTLLATLKDACDIPALRFLEPNAVGAYADIVPVDLALDIGTSRTTALLAERELGRSGTSAARLATIRPLPLRDISEPYRVVTGAVSSRLVFARAVFGNEALSRWSGRTQAFHWPSPVRIGDEAERLAAEPTGAQAITGVSSPLHYVWDEQPSRHVWRFAGAVADGARLNPIVSGTILAHLTESGDLIEGRGAHGATTKPRFSRSALTTLHVGELLLHAISAINAPDWRARSPRQGASRRIGRILVTPPAGMGEAETAILRRRVESAVKLVWRALGWAKEAHPLAPPPPAVTMTADSATASQLAYLDNEVTHKFRGRLDSFLALMGKPRGGFAGARTLRVATLDVGAATTGISVATYETSSSGALAATHQLVDGFEIGCDGVIKALAERLIVPALAQRLLACKHGDPDRLLTALLGRAERGRPAWGGDLGRKLASEVLAPAGEALVRLYANAEAGAGDAPSEPTLGELIASVGRQARATADRLDSLAADEGADGFSPLEVRVPFLMRDLAEAADVVLRPMLATVVRVLGALDCDLVLLAGRGAHLPVVREALLEGMPLRPDRILLLHRQRFTLFNSPGTMAGGSLLDPKLLPALGALIQGHGALAGGEIDLMIRRNDGLHAHAFIGRVGADGRIADDDVLFSSETVEARPGGGRANPRTPRPVSIALPTLLGERRPSLDGWPARTVWVIERDAAAGGRPPKMPVRVVLERLTPESGRAASLKLVSAVDGDGGLLDETEVLLRLKTRRFGEGYWLDTGLLEWGLQGATESGV